MDMKCGRQDRARPGAPAIFRAAQATRLQLDCEPIAQDDLAKLFQAR
jgi:hypothetical protein